MKRLKKIRDVASIILATLLLASPLCSAEVDTAGGDDHEPGFIGVSYEPSELGVRVTAVLPGGPAEKAGIEKEDVLVTAGDQVLGGLSAVEVYEVVSGFRPGEEVPIQLLRSGNPRRVTLVPAVAPEQFRVSPEARVRLQQKIDQDRALGQLIRVVKTSKIFVLRRSSEGQVLSGLESKVRSGRSLQVSWSRFSIGLWAERSAGSGREPK